MSRVLVKDQADLCKLQGSLHTARRQWLQSLATEHPGEADPTIERLLHRSTAEIAEALQLCVKSAETGSGDLQGSSAAECEKAEEEVAALDTELKGLRQSVSPHIMLRSRGRHARNALYHFWQVVDAARRVAQLRGLVPAALSNHFSARLQACRPAPCTAEPTSAAAEQADGAIQPDALSPAPAKLQSKLASVTVQMPMLRAELQEKLERLQRIVEVIDREAQAAAAGGPGTVERAARGMATPGSRDVPSPKLAQAVSAGKIATRKRAMAGLRPVPYPAPTKS